MEIIRLIEGSDLNISNALDKFDVPRSTYYRWRRKYRTWASRVYGIIDLCSLGFGTSCHLSRLIIYLSTPRFIRNT